MFSHICIGISDFEKAFAFYTPLMETLNIKLRFCEPERPWAGWQSAPNPRPLFIIAKPFDGRVPTPGNGTKVMCCLP